FGVPSVLADPFGVLLPVAELAVAVALILAATTWWGALGALALLLLFVAGIGSNWHVGDSRSATVSGTCTRLLLAGPPCCATWSWPLWPWSWSPLGGARPSSVSST